MTSLHDISPRPAPMWLLYAAFAGLGSGLVVYLIIFGVRLHPLELLWSIGAGMCYTLLMMTATRLAVAALDRRLPLRSRHDVLARVGVLAPTTVLSFLLATAILELLGIRLFASGGTLIVVMLVAFSATAVGTSIHYLDRLHRHVRSAEEAAVRAEIGALRAQINPHFLFNSLNSIASLIRTAPAEAERVTESLADLFRYSLRASSHPAVTLAEELESVELYLAIERARFRDRLAVVIEIPEELGRLSVPSLLLQPLVENGVKHGVGRTEGACTIELRGWIENGGTVLRVTDSGPGFDSTDEEIVLARGTGLANVRDRLLRLFGDRARLTILPNGVELRLPVFPSGTRSPIPDTRSAIPDTRACP